MLKIQAWLKLFVVCSLFVILAGFTRGALTDNLISYWSFDTNANDDYSNNDLTVTGATQTASGCKLGGGCYELDGLNDRLERSDDADFDFGASDSYSVCIWFAQDNPDGIDIGLVYKYSGGIGYQVRKMSSEKLANTIRDGSIQPFYFTAQTINTDDTFNYACAVRDVGDDTLKIYLDGFLRFSNTDTTTGSLENVGSLFVGHSVYNNNYFDGVVDEFGFWSKALDDDTCTINTTCGGEIGSLYNSGDGCNPLLTNCEVSGSLTLNTSLINNTNSTDNPFTFNFNGSVSQTVDLFNCTFNVNGTLEESFDLSPINNTNHQFNFSNGNGAYLFNVTCINNESVSADLLRNVFIDTISPEIQTNLTNNSFYQKDVDILSLFVNYSDTNLEAINNSIYRLDTNRNRVSLINNTFVQDIITSDYIFNFSDDFSSSNWIDNTEYEMEAEIWDGHTANILRFHPNKVINTLHYGNIKFYCDNTDTMDFILESDRVKPVITFTNNAIKQTCYYQTTGKFYKVKRKDNSLSLWYVDLENRIWIDEKHNNIETNLISPQLLKIVYTFDTPTNNFISDTFGDLNFNSASYFFEIGSFTSYLANSLNISDVEIVGASWQLVSNTSFNTTQTETFISNLALNSQKTVVGGSNTLFVNFTIDGQQIYSDSLRTMTGLAYGVSGFTINNTLTSGNHFIELFFRETGSGNVQLSNIDFTGLALSPQNNEQVCDFIFQSDVLTSTATTYTSVLDYNVNNNYSSSIYTQHRLRINASGSTVGSFYINDTVDNINSSLIMRYLSGSTDIGSMFLSYIDTGILAYKNYSLMAKNSNTETITIDSQTVGYCLNTINGTTINSVTGTNPTTNLDNNLTLTAGTHNIINASIVIRNGTSLYSTGSFTFKSESGTQTPTFNITANDCSNVKLRTLSSNDDIGNSFASCVLNGFSVGDTVNIDAYITVEAGETLVLIDESINIFEVGLIPFGEINLAPVVTLTTDLNNITAGEDAIFQIEANDFNGDNIDITVLWFVDGTNSVNQTASLSNGQTQNFTLTSGNYVAGQLVNATIKSNDGFLDGVDVFTSTREVQTVVTTDTLLLTSINDTLNSLNQTNNQSRGDMSMLWIIIGVIFFIVVGALTRLFLLWSVAGGLFFLAYLRMGEIFLTDNNTYFKAGMYFMFFVAIAFMLVGIALQIGFTMGLFKGGGKDIYKDFEY